MEGENSAKQQDRFTVLLLCGIKAAKKIQTFQIYVDTWLFSPQNMSADRKVHERVFLTEKGQFLVLKLSKSLMYIWKAYKDF